MDYLTTLVLGGLIILYLWINNLFYSYQVWAVILITILLVYSITTKKELPAPVSTKPFITQTKLFILLSIATIVFFIFCLFFFFQTIGLQQANASLGKAFFEQRTFLTSICEIDYNSWVKEQERDLLEQTFEDLNINSKYFDINLFTGMKVTN